MFNRASDSANPERSDRGANSDAGLVFGVDYLDDALRGICRDDLILLGAPSGVGKTQLCCNIALANLENGKKVHYIALEAAAFEIERRLKYPLVVERYYADPQRPRLINKLNYPDWYLGKFIRELEKYEGEAATYFESAYRDLYLYSRNSKFGVDELIEAALYCSGNTSLIILDHVHYFDFDDDNENRALKEIAKTVRALALEERIPIILVAHLRKRDKQNDELCAGMDEFHGSSDLFKIATKVVTFAPGKLTNDGKYETFFRIPKNRLDGSVSRFLGRTFFDPRKGGYEKGKYQLGWSDQRRSKGFEMCDVGLWPDWARRSGEGGGSLNGAEKLKDIQNKTRSGVIQNMPFQD